MHLEPLHQGKGAIKMKRYYLFLAAVLLLISGAVSAATIEMNHSWSNGLKINYTINNGTTDIVRIDGWAGQFSPVQLDFDSDTSTWTPDLTTISYCVDLLEFTYSGGETYEVDLIPAAFHGTGYLYAAWLMETFKSVADTAGEMAGLQVAIWEVVYDTTYSLDDGNFSVQSTGSEAYSNANIYLSSLLVALAGPPTLFEGLDRYMVAYSETKQDQLIATPIPMAVWLFGSGLLGMLAFRKRPAEV